MANRKIYTFLMLGFFMTLAMTAFGQGVGVVQTAAAPTIDGDVGDAAWDAATPLDIANVSSGVMDDAFAAEFKLLWDADNLYVSISVQDDTLRNDNKPSGFAQDQNDFIDIYLDMDRRFPCSVTNPNQGPANGSWWNLYDVNDFQIQLVRDKAFLGIGGQFPGNVIDSTASGITIAQAEVAGGYTFEVAIPYDNMIAGGFDAVHNARLGLDIMVGDADGDTLRDGRVAWNMEEGVDLAWRQADLWGTIVLDDGSGASLPAVNPAVGMAASAPTIDGDADDLWTDVPFREIRNTSSGIMDNSFGADYKALWDADNLYLLVDVQDDSLTNDNKPSGLAQDQNDFVDIYIDMDRIVGPKMGWHFYDANDFQIQLLRDADFLNIGGQNRTITVAESGITYGQTEKADGSGWMLEVQIPLTNLDAGFTAEHNARLGFEIMVGDADADTLRDGRVAWNMATGVDLAWSDPKLWGTLILSDGSGISAPAEGPAIPETAVAPAIDGAIDALWSSVDFRDINNTTSGAMDNTFAAEFKAVWDATNLYLLVEVQDDVLKTDNKPSGFAQDQNDYIDIYLDTDMKFPHTKTNDNGSWWNYYDTTDFQIQFLRDAAFLNIGGQNSANDVDSTASGITLAQAEVTGGWLLELSIPWANMDPNFVPAHDTPFGLEVMVGDADADTLRNGRNAWSMTDDLAWQQPLLWGTLVLSDGGKIESKVLSLENDLNSTSIGEIDAENNAIIEIPKNTTAAELVAAIKVSAGATAEVFDGSGAVADPDNTEIAESGMFLRILSEKGLWNDVNLALELVSTGLSEDFEDALTAADSAIWFTNTAMHDDGVTPVFDISIADGVLNYDLMQKEFHNGIKWQVGMLNLAENPMISLDIKIEDASYDDGTGAVVAAALPVQISLFSPDPEGGDDIRAANFRIDVPAAAAGAGTFETYYYDLTQGDAWMVDTSLALIDTVTWILFETVTWPGVYDATISLDNVGIGDQALTPPLPAKTGFSEDFEGEIDMDIWDANRGTHADGTTRMFVVSGDNGALKVEMNQFEFPDGQMFVFTKNEWVLDASDPANQVVTMKVKVEGASYDDGTGRVDIETVPFQVSLFANVPDPADEESERTRVGSVSYMVPSAAAGEGEFVEYYFDFSADLASRGYTHNPEELGWALLVETVRWPGTHQATYWLDDIKIGDAVVPYVQSTDATVHSTLYGTLGDGAISMVDPTTSVTAFLLGIAVQDSATVMIIESSGGSEVGNPDRTDVATGMVVVVTAEDGTVKEYAITTDATGISTLNAESIALYPNPASEILNISNTSPFARVEIANVTGQSIEIIQVTSNNTQVDVSGYDAGIYFLILESQEYGNVIRKFVKK
jgi:hypothetical protein